MICWRAAGRVGGEGVMMLGVRVVGKGALPRLGGGGPERGAGQDVWEGLSEKRRPAIVLARGAAHNQVLGDWEVRLRYSPCVSGQSIACAPVTTAVLCVVWGKAQAWAKGNGTDAPPPRPVDAELRTIVCGSLDWDSHAAQLICKDP